MTTTFTLTGNLVNLIGGEVKATAVWLGTNLGRMALIDLDNNKTHPPGLARLDVSAGVFSAELIATDSTGINVLDGSLRYIVYVEYSDGRGGKPTWNSGYFELTADTDLSDVAGTSVAVDVDDVTGMVSSLVEQAVQDHTPGIELGVAQRTTTFTTTNTTAGNGALGIVTSLSVTVVGKGRPADVEFYCPAAYHSVAGAFVAISINLGNPLAVANTQLGSVQSTLTSNGPAFRVTLRSAVLTDGASYTFQVNAWGSTAGTVSLVAAAYCPVQLTVTSR